MMETSWGVGPKAVLIGLTLLVVVVVVAILLMGDGVQMKRLFASEVQEELDKATFFAGVFTDEDFASLPAPIERYFRHLGYVGQRKTSTVKIIYDEAAFKNGNMDLKMYSEQFNFVQEPARIVYMIAKVGGVIPFEGRDKYQNGEGYMTGKLAKLFKLFDVTGPEVSQSGLVTTLAECLVVPSYALQDYITWEEMDEHQAKATIRYKGAQATGIFTISDDCESATFRSTDRYMDKGSGVFELVPWRAEVVGLREQDGIALPSRFRGIWEMPEGDLVYFDSELSSVDYDVDRL